MKIQKVPRGLLELFKLRQTGEYPDDMSRTLLPMVDVSAYYACDTLIPASSVAAGGALLPELVKDFTISPSLGVLSLGGSLTIGAAAATNLTISWGILLPGAPTRAVMGSMFVAQAGIGAVVRFGSAFPRFIAPSGSTLFSAVCGTAAGVDHTLTIAGLLENLSGSSG